MQRPSRRLLTLVLTVAGAAVPPAAAAGAQQTAAAPPALDSAGCFTRDAAPARTDSVGRARQGVREGTGDTTSPGARQERGPAIVLFAAATAREVRFTGQPRISVRLCGALMDSVRVVERRNLPDPVQPGVTYRDVYVAVEILGHLRAECLAARITGQRSGGVCAALQLRDSAGASGRSPP